MSQKARDNLGKLKNAVEKEALHLAIHLHEGGPQLVIASIAPRKNKRIKAFCFYVFPFVIPNDDVLTILPNNPVELEIKFLGDIITGISDSLFKKISFEKISENMRKLKNR